MTGAFWSLCPSPLPVPALLFPSGFLSCALASFAYYSVLSPLLHRPPYWISPLPFYFFLLSAPPSFLLPSSSLLSLFLPSPFIPPFLPSSPLYLLSSLFLPPSLHFLLSLYPSSLPLFLPSLPFSLLSFFFLPFPLSSFIFILPSLSPSSLLPFLLPSLPSFSPSFLFLSSLTQSPAQPPILSLSALTLHLSLSFSQDFHKVKLDRSLSTEICPT